MTAVTLVMGAGGVGKTTVAAGIAALLVSHDAKPKAAHRGHLSVIDHRAIS